MSKIAMLMMSQAGNCSSPSSEDGSSASIGTPCIGEFEDRDEVSPEPETRYRTIGVTNRKFSEELPSVSEDVTRRAVLRCLTGSRPTHSGLVD